MFHEATLLDFTYDAKNPRDQKELADRMRKHNNSVASGKLMFAMHLHRGETPYQGKSSHSYIFICECGCEMVFGFDAPTLKPQSEKSLAHLTRRTELGIKDYVIAQDDSQGDLTI